MAIIRVPKPPQSAFDPERPASSLLKTQIRHLHEAERMLPPGEHSDMYVNRIRTEREAAAYIQHVTARLHSEGAPLAKRVSKAKRRPATLAIAAQTETKTKRRSAANSTSRSSSKTKSPSSGRRQSRKKSSQTKKSKKSKKRLS
jgi:hypothetical protein